MVAKIALCIGLLSVPALPVMAHKLVEPGETRKVAKGTFEAVSGEIWNRLQQNEGKYQEVWTKDGHQLNRIAFYGGVPDGKPLIKERHKKRDPLPKISEAMLLPDIPVLLERTYRTQYGIPVFEIGTQEPASLAGHDGIRFEYRYVDPSDEVERLGEGYGAIVNGELHLVTFEAPALHFFERDVQEFRGIVERLRIRD